MKNTLPAPLLGALAAVSLMVFDLFQPTLPAITSYFNTTHALAQMTLSLYLLFLGVGQFLWGPIVDSFGRRKPYMISMLVFFVATLCCIYAPSIEVLIISRIFQSLTASIASVIALSSTRDAEDPIFRARQMSIISMTVALSPIFSPIIGAFLFNHFGWQSNFVFMLVAVGLFSIYGLIKITESPHFNEAHKKSFSQFIAAYKEVLTTQVFWVGSMILMFAFSCSIIFVINASYILITQFQLTPSQFAYAFGFFGLFIIIGNYLGIYLRELFSLVFNIYFGCLLILAGSLAMTLIFYIWGMYLPGLIPMVVVVTGVSIILPAVQTRVLEPFTKTSATASSVLNTIRTIGASLLGGAVGIYMDRWFLLFPLSILFCGACISLIYFFAIPSHIRVNKRR